MCEGESSCGGKPQSDSGKRRFPSFCNIKAGHEHKETDTDSTAEQADESNWDVSERENERLDTNEDFLSSLQIPENK